MPIPYRRVDCNKPGISRQRKGRGFVYLQNGKRVEDAYTISRIRNLGIPPAWKDVWICSDDKGHIQAIGTDAAGRKQYLYHQKWRERRDQQKFDKMIQFAENIPKVREVTNEHLALSGMPKDRALACAVRLMDRGFFRIGSEGYTEQNQSYGLATMLKDHVTLGKGGDVTFDFVGKSGKVQHKSVVDPLVFETVAALKRRRGGSQELLAYKVGNAWFDVKSIDINEYLKRLAGSEYSAKDFRTWHATVWAAIGLAVSYATATSQTARKRAISRMVKEVAEQLGNTPAVARRSYIDPRVIDQFENGITIGGTLEMIGDSDPFDDGTLGIVEEAVLDLVRGKKDSEHLDQVA